MAHPLIAAIRTGLADLADPAKAPDMRRYMKSEMPFRGLPTPERRPLGRRLFAEYPLPDVTTLQQVVRELWRGAEYREERYLAIDLTGYSRYTAWQSPRLLPLYEREALRPAESPRIARSRRPQRRRGPRWPPPPSASAQRRGSAV